MSIVSFFVLAAPAVKLVPVALPGESPLSELTFHANTGDASQGGPLRECIVSRLSWGHWHKLEELSFKPPSLAPKAKTSVRPE